VLTALASIGLPGTSGFVGEFLALLGTFESHPELAVVATLGVIFAAYYMLPMVQRVFFNALETDENRHVQDLSGREIAILAPLCALMIWIGWHPTPILERMGPSVQVVLDRVEFAGAQAEAGGDAPQVAEATAVAGVADVAPAVATPEEAQ
jgi:NADH-quinone oxidoreductase subunit M